MSNEQPKQSLRVFDKAPVIQDKIESSAMLFANLVMLEAKNKKTSRADIIENTDGSKEVFVPPVYGKVRKS